MKSTMYILLYIMIGIWSGIGCEKQPMPEPVNPQPPKIDWPDSLGRLPILWYSTAHAPDTSSSWLYDYATEDGVITVNQLGDPVNECYVRLLDKESGKEKWFWNRMPVDHYSDIEYLPERNMIMVKKHSYHAILDCKTGQEILYSQIPKVYGLKEPKAIVIGDYLYTGVYWKNSNPNDSLDWAHLVRIKIHGGQIWEKVFDLTEHDVDGFSPSFEDITPWIHPFTGDTILLLTSVMFNWQKWHDSGSLQGVERTDLTAFNVSKGKVEWKIDSICKSTGRFESPPIFNNKVYFKDGIGPCIDLLDKGKILWTAAQYCGYPSMYDPVNNSIIGFFDKLYAIDSENGNFKWVMYNPKLPIGAYGIELHNNYLYFNDPHQEMYVINAANGQVVYKEFPMGPVFRSNLGSIGRSSVDPVHRLLYVNDLWGTFCLKLPDEWFK